MHLVEPYDTRPVECLEVFAYAGWRIKVYGITYRDPRPGDRLIRTAKELARTIFPLPAATDNRYERGFVGIHQGRGSNFLFFCWWENENELLHRVFVAESDRMEDFVEQSSDDVRACVWDVVVIAHERNAWVRHVLANPDGPDLDAYLYDQLTTEV